MNQDTMTQEKIAMVLKDSASTLVKVASERDEAVADNVELRQKVAHLEIRHEAERLAVDMIEKNAHQGVPFEMLTETLEKKAHESPDDFRILREAVGLTGPDMFKTATVGGKETAGGVHDFERFIIGDVS